MKDKVKLFIDKILDSYLFWIIFFLFIAIFISLTLVYGANIIFKEESLNILITSASIIVALITGFLFNYFFYIHQIRAVKIQRFAELQKDLIPYRESIYWWIQQIMRNNPKIDFKLGKDYEKFLKEIDWENDEKAEAILFIRSLYGFSQEYYDTPDFEKEYSLISQKQLNKMEKAIQKAAGLLGRYKHFKYILKTFGWKDTQNLDEIIVAKDIAGFQYLVKKINKRNKPWQNLGFWEIKIGESLDILERMISNSKFIYSYVPKNIKKFSTLLVLCSIFGVVFPLVILFYPNIIISTKFEAFILNLSVVGFLGFFSFVLISLFTLLTHKKPVFI